MIVSPSGLSSSEAIFASSLFGVTPIEHDRPVASRTACLIDCASARTRAPDGSCGSPAVSDIAQVGEVDVDLVDAAVFDLRRDRAHRLLEHARITAVFVEVGRQQHRVGRERGGLHQAHARIHAERARFVGGGRDHAAAGVVAQRRELARVVLADRVLGRLVAAPAADHERPAAQLGIAQQLDGRIERIHVEMGDVRLAASHGCTQSEVAEQKQLIHSKALKQNGIVFQITDVWGQAWGQ